MFTKVLSIYIVYYVLQNLNVWNIIYKGIFVFLSRRSLRNDTINRSNPYELPNRGINEGEHEYESAMELDVNTNAYENTGIYSHIGTKNMNCLLMSILLNMYFQR